MGLGHAALVRADGHLVYVLEAQQLQRGLDLRGGDLVAELSGEGRGHLGIDLLAVLHGADQLEDLALVGDGAEGAGDHAHAAGHALVLVDAGAAHAVGLNGLHAAGLGAGALVVGDGVVGADVLATAALDALALVDDGLAVHLLNGAARAHGGAGMGDAAAALVGHHIGAVGAGGAGRGDHLHQRRLVVLLVDVGFGESVGDVGGAVVGAQAQAHGQAQLLGHDGALLPDVAVVYGNVAGDDLVGNFFEIGQRGVTPGQPGDGREDLMAQLADGGIDTSHGEDNSFRAKRL